MKLEGSYDVKAPRQKVWEAFLDPETLRQAIPGCEKLELIGNDEYKATLKIGVAAVKGTFEGKVRLLEKKPPESYRLAAEGSGGPGFVRADTLITLTAGRWPHPSRVAPRPAGILRIARLGPGVPSPRAALRLAVRPRDGLRRAPPTTSSRVWSARPAPR